MESQIEQALDKVRPYLEMHGGDIELVKISKRDRSVHIHFTGTCGHCAISEITLMHLVTKEIRKTCPGIERVIPVAND